MVPVTYTTCYPAAASRMHSSSPRPAGLMLTASIICTAESGCQLIPCSNNGGEEISCCTEIVQKVKEGLCVIRLHFHE